MKNAPACTISRLLTAISIPTCQPFLIRIQRDLNSLIVLQIEESLWNRTSLGRCFVHWGLGTSITGPSRMACWTQQRQAPWCLFDSSTKEIGSIWCRSKAFTIGGNWQRTQRGGSFIRFLWQIWDSRLLMMRQYCVRVRTGDKVKVRVWWCDLMVYGLRVQPDGKLDTTWYHTAQWYNLMHGLVR